jgi:hypothetical protein
VNRGDVLAFGELRSAESGSNRKFRRETNLPYVEFVQAEHTVYFEYGRAHRVE